MTKVTGHFVIMTKVTGYFVTNRESDAAVRQDLY